MPSYSQNQSVFTLSILANLGSAIAGTIEHIESALSSTIDAQLLDFRPEIGTWTVVWGPAVYLALGSDLPDNVIYVAHAGPDTVTPGQLVVAVAGTNPYSPFDWLLEDSYVEAPDPWPTGIPPLDSNRRVSRGSLFGLSVLQTRIPGLSMPGAGIPLTDFLSAGLPSSRLITVTGHSLGGALSPLFALFLSDTQETWDPAMQTKIACLASAGPTPGNGDFATYFSSQLGPATTRFWNALDVVPHVWNAVEIAAIPSLYAPDIPSDPLVQALAENARVMSLLGDYTHITQVAGQPGTVNKSQTLFDAADGDFANYIRQLRYQHVDAYAELFDVPKLGKVMSDFAPPLDFGTAPSRLAALRLALQRRLLMLGERIALRTQTTNAASGE
jgi:Lipase (class 3)